LPAATARTAISRSVIMPTIARERGIAAYHAWVPFERIRPVNISQENGKRHLLGLLIMNHRTLR
jgi:hypothetical protein